MLSIGVGLRLQNGKGLNHKHLRPTVLVQHIVFYIADVCLFSLLLYFEIDTIHSFISNCRLLTV